MESSLTVDQKLPPTSDLISSPSLACCSKDVDIIEGNLNRRKYEDRSGQAEKCVICLDELKCNDEASTLACGHDFHYECIKNWLMVKNKCPLYKQQAL
ncbi:hypothetical protein F2Q69_00054974 [Brassica cretica]|uniref:RING-type E3 ubiquitin transferase n=1 Tax=Brassica cretica TaxID=69181 RepID=A0A8S9MUE2_BRACR|nr:hypothetical protein F2Q69_00054974 [Brassica cretica]